MCGHDATGGAPPQRNAMRGKVERAIAGAPPVIVPAPRLAPIEVTRRWAALLRQIFEVDPLACPTCHGVMRIHSVHHAGVGDRPDAHPSSDPRLPGRAQRRTKSLIDPAPVWTIRDADGRRLIS